MSFGPKAWKNAPDNTTPLSAAALIDLETRLSNYTDAEVAALLGTLQVVEVNALPGSPVDGQQVDYYPSGTIGTGVCWRCTWRDALNGGVGAWLVHGGAPLVALTAGQSTRTNTTYGALADGAGPSLVVPVKGVYDITIEVGEMWSSVGGDYAAASYSGAGITASDAHAAIQGAINNRVSVTTTFRQTVTAGTITAVYRTNAAATVSAAKRRLTAWPIELRP